MKVGKTLSGFERSHIEMSELANFISVQLL